jgi:hypothetical protein
MENLSRGVYTFRVPAEIKGGVSGYIPFLPLEAFLYIHPPPFADLELERERERDNVIYKYYYYYYYLH